MTARAIESNADLAFREVLRRSPLPPADIFALKRWISDSLDELRVAAEDEELDNVLCRKLLEFVRAKSVKGISDQTLVEQALQAWVSGRTFVEIKGPLTAADARIGGAKITIEHTVALCEGGFGYELSMVTASAADLLELVDEELSEQVASVQRRVKYGLSDEASLAFFEAGFSDRVVAQALGTEFDDAVDRQSVRRVCRRRADKVEAVLSDFPSYFESVAAELRG